MRRRSCPPSLRPLCPSSPLPRPDRSPPALLRRTSSEAALLLAASALGRPVHRRRARPRRIVPASLSLCRFAVRPPVQPAMVVPASRKAVYLSSRLPVYLFAGWAGGGPAPPATHCLTSNNLSTKIYGERRARRMREEGRPRWPRAHTREPT